MEKVIRRGGMWSPKGYLFELSGGDLSLDFVNTVDNRPTEHPRELLTRYSDICSWSRYSGMLSREREAFLVKKAARNPKEAERARKRMVALRECFFQVLIRVIAKEEIPQKLLKEWNRFVHLAMERYELAHGKKGFQWQCFTDAREFDSILWPIIHSAVRLLTGPNVSRIRRCAADSCDWMFLDTSKRGNRRWCDMTVCGNRAKARRFYSKKKARPS